MLNRLLLVALPCIFCLSVCRAEETDSLSADTASVYYVSVPPARSIYLDEVSVWDGLPILKLAGPGSINDFSPGDFRRLHPTRTTHIVELGNGGVCRCLGYVGQPCFSSLRGSSARSVLYLRDGIPVNDDMTGLFDLSFLSGVALRRIEVMNDCGSSIYGPSACGGVVNLVTKKFDGEVPYSRVKVAGGSENLTDTELEFGRGFGGSWKGYLSGRHLEGDGFRPHTDFDIEDFNGDVSYDFGKTEAGLSLWRRDGKVGVPEDTFGSGLPYHLEDILLLGSAYLRSDELEVRVYYTDLWQQESDTVENSPVARTGATIGGHGRKVVYFGRNRVVLGVAGRNRDVEAGDSISGDITDGGVTASASLEVLPLVWVSPSVSFWHDEIYGREVSPKLSVSMTYSLGFALFASFARGFSSPTLAELLSASSGNRDLGPEHLLSYSGGVRYEVGDLSLKLDAFFTETSDLIESQNDTSGLSVNTGWKASVRGVNLGMKTELRRVTGGVNVSVASSNHSCTEEDVPYTPAVAAGAHLGYRDVFRKGDLGVRGCLTKAFLWGRTRF
jgi:outer membrane receptor protein involved in Fe transport